MRHSLQRAANIPEMLALTLEAMVFDSEPRLEAFLREAVVRNTDIYGSCLAFEPNTFTLDAYALALQGALGITGAEMAVMRNDAGILNSGQNNPPPPLSLQNVTAIYRRSLLAKALGLSAFELSGFKGLSGVNPFATLACSVVSV